MKKLFYLLLVVGIVTLVIVPTWTYAIVPSKLVMPEDVNESVTFTGEASVANPQDFSQLMGPYDLNIERSYEGIGKTDDGDAVILSESVTMEIDNPMIPPETRTYVLAVDKRTFEHLDEDGAEWDHARNGQFAFDPYPEKKDVEFWLHDLNDTITVKYKGMDSYKGLNVLWYTINDRVQITKNPELLETYSGLAYYYANSRLDALYLKENSYFYVDEISGIIVYFARNSKLSGELTELSTDESSTVILSKMIYNYDDESSDTLVNDAKEVDKDIEFYETTVPIIIMVIGTLIILAAVALKLSKIRRDGE